MNIAERLKEIQTKLPDNIKLIAISKTKTKEDILEAYNTGHIDFGENRVAELQDKYNSLSKNIHWHFIGHLQSKKVKTIAPFVSLIHAVDSFKLLEIINKEAKKNNRTIDCLLQFHIARETSKYGLSLPQANDFLNSEEFINLKNVRIVGVMGMATFTNDEKIVRAEFKSLKKIFTTLKENYFEDKSYFREISMGMSNDFLIAIEEGSTMVRIGSKIFGRRN